MNRLPRRSPQRTAAIAAAILWGGLVLALVVLTGWSLYLDWLIAGTATTLLAFAIDKTQARRSGRRIPELVLQVLSLAGGVIGGWLGMIWLRHKTLHRSFWAVQWVATVLHLALAWILWL
jgi:uncharacterized membrane protein YsdA (DUF1294 family)